MSKFRDFYNAKETPPLGYLGSEIDERLMIIARMAATNHLEKLLDFYEKLAKKDSNIKVELENFKRDPSSEKPYIPFSSKEIDTIATFPSDGSATNDLDGEE